MLLISRRPACEQMDKMHSEEIDANPPGPVLPRNVFMPWPLARGLFLLLDLDKELQELAVDPGRVADAI